MPGRSFNTSSYKYSHNGQEKDDEIFQGALSAEYWEYDSRTGRRWENDPLTYPWQSPYATFNNNPIYFADPTGLEGEGDGDKKGPDKKTQDHINSENKKHEKNGGHRETVYDSKTGGVIERDKAGGNQSVDAKTNPGNTTGSNTPPTEQKAKNPIPNDPSAQNKENNGGGGLNNIVNNVKRFLGSMADSEIAKKANEYAPTVTGIAEKIEKISEKLTTNTRQKRVLDASKGMNLPSVPIFLSKSRYSIKIPTKILSGFSKIIKPIAKTAPALGYLATGLKVLTSRKITAGDVVTAVAAVVVGTLSAPLVVPAALIIGGLEAGFQFFTGKSISDGVNDVYDKLIAPDRKKKGGIIFTW